ncbi:hypothetical protein PV367_28220 [Streptomyces europaeiscabiei]|uniref:Uncharacterized protein n=1 Tax=Streptomyces europaeiscabiei TaxID=146819 RepID=A0AAJ2PUY4_9ACTN|nr:hypothetical protein [Streptomyces europaeiscabiei]MDX3133577.1 hypothetical protein [Streptomyces europaeiscabiei]
MTLVVLLTPVVLVVLLTPVMLVVSVTRPDIADAGLVGPAVSATADTMAIVAVHTLLACLRNSPP